MHDAATGDIVGVKDPDGSEFFFARAANYGVFYDLSDQTASVNTPAAIRFDTPAMQEGVAIADATKITFSRGGKFSFALTAQIENSDSQAHEFYLWGRLNGVDIPNTLTRVTIPSSHGGINGALVLERSYFGSLDAGQYIQVMWMTDSASISLNYTSAQSGPPELPATPSVGLLVHEVAK